MFKKTLLAVAIAGVSVGAQAASIFKADANAGTIAIDNAAAGADKPFQVSAQGAVGAASLNFGGSNLGLNFEVDDANGDKGFNTLKTVTLTLSNATIHPSSAPTVTIFDEAGADATGGTAGDNTVAIGAATVTYPTTNNQIVFTFDAADRAQLALLTAGNGVTANSADEFQFLVDGIAITNDLAAGTTVNATLEFVSEVGSTVIDSASVDFAKVINQFSVKVSDSLTDKLDVSKGRKEFVTGDADKKTQTLAIDLEQAAIDLNAATSAGATNDDLVVTVNGDFTFADADGDDKVDTGFTATGYQKGGQSLKVTTAAPAITAAAATDTSTFNLVTDGNAVLSTQSFTYDLSVSYNNAGLNDGVYTASGSAGAWTLNGAEANIPFMPFSSAFSQSVTIANTGTVDGGITVDWTYNGDTITTELTATATPESVTDISAELRSIAAANNITGNAALKIVVNSPSGSIAVKALYYSKADADRGIVL